MKVKTLAFISVLSAFLLVMTTPAEATDPDVVHEDIMISPDGELLDSLNIITVSTGHPDGFGAFVYMPSLYSVNYDGSLGVEVSACELMDDTVRGKHSLQFRVINPPFRKGRYTFLIKDNSFSLNNYGQTGNDHSLDYDENTDPNSKMRSNAPQATFRNFPVDLQSDTLRILHISNSYGGNLLHYVDGLLRAANVDVSTVLIERLVYTGGSFKNWFDVSRDKNKDIYCYFHMAGDLAIDMTGWEGAKYDGSKFRMILENPWNLIILNQASRFATAYENWNSTKDGGYLSELIAVIRKYHPSVPIGALLIHSIAEDYKDNTQHLTTTQRWERICDGVQWLQNVYNVDFVIPYGTAIENLRSTQYNTAHDLTGDGTHLASGLAEYTAGCCYFETVFSPRCKHSVWGNSLREELPEAQSTDTYKDAIIGIDDTSSAIAQKAAFLASRNMYEVRNPELADLTEYKYGEKLNQTEYRSVFRLTGKGRGTSADTYCIYGPTGILIGESMTEEEWMNLPEGLYIRDGEKIYKSKSAGFFY